jgi:hypothetical protein
MPYAYVYVRRAGNTRVIVSKVSLSLYLRVNHVIITRPRLRLRDTREAELDQNRCKLLKTKDLKKYLTNETGWFRMVVSSVGSTEPNRGPSRKGIDKTVPCFHVSYVELGKGHPETSEDSTAQNSPWAYKQDARCEMRMALSNDTIRESGQVCTGMCGSCP